MSENIGGFSFLNHSDYMRNAKRTLERHGNKRIISMEIYRDPLPAFVHSVAKSYVPDLPYDKLFHLGLLITLEDYKKVVVEKVAYVNVSDDLRHSSNIQYFPLKEPFDFTIAEMLEKTKERMGEKNFYAYNAFSNNCQVFLRECLSTVGKLSENADKFVWQNAPEIKKKIPRAVQFGVNALTNLGNIAARITGGNDDKRFVQSVHFSNSVVKSQARKWLKDKNLKPIGNAKQFEHHYSFTIAKPEPNTNYATKKINNHILVVYGN